MARQKRAALSHGFDTARLDAIGKRKVLPDSDNLWIDWRRPAGLREDWVPLDLRFSTSYEEMDPAPDLYDPDDRMFELYELFRSRQAAFVAQLREVAAEIEEEVGPVVRARLEVDRHTHPDPDMCHCALQVTFEFAEDDEHASYSRYDPESGRFGPLEG